jgi:hypothetical protein
MTRVSVALFLSPVIYAMIVWSVWRAGAAGYTSNLWRPLSSARPHFGAESECYTLISLILPRIFVAEKNAATTILVHDSSQGIDSTSSRVDCAHSRGQITGTG